MDKETFEKAHEIMFRISQLKSNPFSNIKREAHKKTMGNVEQIRDGKVDFIYDKEALGESICSLSKDNFLKIMDLYKELYQQDQEQTLDEVRKLEKEFKEL